MKKEQYELETSVRFGRSNKRAKVVATDQGVRVGERFVPRRRLQHGALVRRLGERTFVALRGDFEIDVDVKDEAEGDAFVKALALDAATSTIEISVNAALSGAEELLVIAMIMIPGAVIAWLAGAWLFVLPFGLVGFLMSGLFGRARVRIGADGLVIHRPWGTSTFVSHDDIDEMTSKKSVVVLRRRHGREVRLEMQALPNDEVDGITRRILQAQQTHRDATFTPEISAAVGRGSRTTREWMTELRGLGEGAASTFRTIGVAREQLLDLIESTTAPTKDRVAAVVALRKTLREEEKTRIRVATDRTAKEEVRARLVRVLDARDDQELEEELEALKDDRRVR